MIVQTYSSNSENRTQSVQIIHSSMSSKNLQGCVSKTNNQNIDLKYLKKAVCYLLLGSTLYLLFEDFFNSTIFSSSVHFMT